MRYSFALAATLLAVSCSFAGDLVIGGDVKYHPSQIVKLKALGVGEKTGILWRVKPNKELSKPSLTPKHSLEFSAPSGTYEVTLLAMTITDGVPGLEEIVTTVTIGQPPPVPPSPITDPLLKDLQAAYSADTDSKKAEQLKTLLLLYQESGITADDQTLKTVAELSSAMHTAVSRFLPNAALTALRVVIQKDLTTVLGSDPATKLTDELRSKSKAEFARIAGLLEELK